MFRDELRTTKAVCPNCGNSLANIQGVDTCTDCEWTSR